MVRWLCTLSQPESLFKFCSGTSDQGNQTFFKFLDHSGSVTKDGAER